MKKIIVLTLVLCFSFSANAQNTSQNILNDYKYVVIPYEYSFLKGENTYRLNTLTKYLFRENGFKAYFDREQLPKDLFKDRCLAIYANVEEVKGGFRRKKLKVTFKDCYGTLIFTSDDGSSSNNNHEEAHHEALRNAFKTIEIKTYNYTPKSDTETTSSNNSKVVADTYKTEKIKTVDRSPKTEIIKTDNSISNVASPSIYYAQEIENGYELVDSSSKVVMILLQTSAKHIYVVKDKNAIVYKEADKWIYSENLNSSIKKDEISIKF